MANDSLKYFLSALSRDDYIEADKHFSSVVKNAVNNVINKKKGAVLDTINAKANQMATEMIKKEG